MVIGNKSGVEDRRFWERGRKIVTNCLYTGSRNDYLSTSKTFDNVFRFFRARHPEMNLTLRRFYE